MEFTPIFNLFLALLILAAVSGVFFFFLLKRMRAHLDMEAYRLYFETTRKADILPQIITRLKTHEPSFNFEELIALRGKTIALSEFNSDKHQLEAGLWGLVGKIMTESNTWPGVKKDHILSALRQDLEEADNRIATMRTAYNRMVAKYNKLSGNLLLKPIARLARTNVMPLF